MQEPDSLAAWEGLLPAPPEAVGCGDSSSNTRLPSSMELRHRGGESGPLSNIDPRSGMRLPSATATLSSEQLCAPASVKLDCPNSNPSKNTPGFDLGLCK
jgi:hypothetical protein